MQLFGNAGLNAIELVPLLPLCHLMIRLYLAPAVHQAGCALIEGRFDAEDVLIAGASRIPEHFIWAIFHDLIAAVVRRGLPRV